MKLNNKYINEYLNANSLTEIPDRYSIWSLLTVVGASVGRNTYYNLGTQKIYPNMMCLLVGTPASRKTTAINAATQLVPDYVALAPQELVNSSLGIIGFMSGKDKKKKKISKDDFAKFLTEDLIEDPEDSVAIETNRETPFAICSEFGTLVKSEAYKLLTVLSQLWDGSEFRHQVAIIKNPTFSLLGAVTPGSLVKLLPPESSEQGFLSRAILVYGEKNGFVPRPVFFDVKRHSELKQLIEDNARLNGTPIKATKDAELIIDSLYTKTNTITDFRFTYYNARRHIHLIKLCINLALLSYDKIITADVVRDAETLLNDTELYMPDCLGEFGLAPLTKVKHMILEFLRQCDEPISSKILRNVASKDATDRDFEEIMRQLEEEKKIYKGKSANDEITFVNARINIMGKQVKRIEESEYDLFQRIVDQE